MDQPNVPSDDFENSRESSSDNDNEVATIMSSTPPHSDVVLINARSGMGAFKPPFPRKSQASVNNRKSDARTIYRYEVRFHPLLQNTKLKASIASKIAENLNIECLQLGENISLFSQTHLKDIDGMPLQENTSIRFLVQAEKNLPSGAIQNFEIIALVRLKKTLEYTCHRLSFTDGRDDKKGIKMKREKDQQLMERSSCIFKNIIELIFVAAFVIPLIAIGLELLFQNYFY